MKTTIKIEKELLEDIERQIANQLKCGKGCGGLRMSDSHAARIEYLFNFWKSEVVYNGAEKRKIQEEMAELKKKEIAEKIADQVGKILDEDPKDLK